MASQENDEFENAVTNFLHSSIHECPTEDAIVKATEQKIKVKYHGLDEDIPFISIYEDIETGELYRDDQIILVHDVDEDGSVYLSLKEIFEVLADAKNKGVIDENQSEFLRRNLIAKVCPF